MRKNALAAIAVASLIAGAASATDPQARQQMQRELTASIPVAGVHALNDIRKALADDLPAGLPLRQQWDQLRAIATVRKPTDKI